jgi:hypothetical protein
MIFSGSKLYDRSSELIESINKILSGEWSQKQISDGKRVEVPRQWGEDVIGITASRYRKEGWKVARIVQLTGEQREYFLSFKNPKWKGYNDQFN